MSYLSNLPSSSPLSLIKSFLLWANEESFSIRVNVHLIHRDDTQDELYCDKSICNLAEVQICTVHGKRRVFDVVDRTMINPTPRWRRERSDWHDFQVHLLCNIFSNTFSAECISPADGIVPMKREINRMNPGTNRYRWLERNNCFFSYREIQIENWIGHWFNQP